MYPYKNLGSCSQTGSAWRFVDGPKELLCSSHQAKEDVVSLLRQKNYDNLTHHPNVTVYTGTGSFTAPDKVEVSLSGREKESLQAPRIFINTGAESIIPPIEGIKGNPHVFTSTSIMELKELPENWLLSVEGMSDWNLLRCMPLSVRK